MRNYDTGTPEQREPIPAAAAAAAAAAAGGAEHSTRIRNYIAAEIADRGGWLSFERYMELALYAPGLGYYCAGAHKFGSGGDFTTAPEISELFGACIAEQCAQVLAAVPDGTIMEIGAGSGRLAGDILASLADLGRLPRRYAIVDISADLRERQRAYLQQRLPQLIGRVEWLAAPPAAAFDGIIVANEVLDALPVTRFRWRRGGVEEMGVAMADAQFTWSARPASAALTERCGVFAATGGGWDDGYVSECCPRLAQWTNGVTRALRAGAVLWIDYGLPRAQYYLPERHEGTLLCHFRQRAHDDPFNRPGLEDITAWVDFTRLAEAGAAAGFAVAGFTTQAHFLAGTSIDRHMQARAGGDVHRFARLANQARQLLMPGEMGERFKAMAWLRGLDLPLAGFSLRDLRHSL